jgi:hypothetical protein
MRSRRCLPVGPRCCPGPHARQDARGYRSGPGGSRRCVCRPPHGITRRRCPCSHDGTTARYAGSCSRAMNTGDGVRLRVQDIPVDRFGALLACRAVAGGCSRYVRIILNRTNHPKHPEFPLTCPPDPGGLHLRQSTKTRTRVARQDDSMPPFRLARPSTSLVEDSGTKGGLGSATCPIKNQKAPPGGNLSNHALAVNDVTYSKY